MFTSPQVVYRFYTPRPKTAPFRVRINCGRLSIQLLGPIGTPGFSPGGLHRRRAFTLTELVVVLIIVGILATIAISGWQAQIEREYEANARATLNALLRAEHNFFAWKGRFTSDWTTLEIDDPNNSDSAYNYTLENVTGNNTIVK